MSVKNISSAILGVGVDDTTIDLFESQYPVPTGVSYNSYIIRDEKTAILASVTFAIHSSVARTSTVSRMAVFSSRMI